MTITRPFVLLALAVLLSPPAEASRTSVWESNPHASLTATDADAAAALASLVPAATADVEITEAPRFNLGDVVLADAADADEEHFDLGPLTLVDLNLLRGPPPSYPETRVGGFELLPPFRIGASPSLSLWPRQACGFSCREVASDSRYDPWGLFDPAGAASRLEEAAARAFIRNGPAGLPGAGSQQVALNLLLSPATSTLRIGEAEGELGYLLAGEIANPVTSDAGAARERIERGMKLTAATVGDAAAVYGAVRGGVQFGQGVMRGVSAGSAAKAPGVGLDASAAHKSLGAKAFDPMSGPVEFEASASWTPEQVAQAKAYVDSANRALEAGALSPAGRVSTKGLLRRQATKAAAEERTRAAAAGAPYRGNAGHGPDTTWTGLPAPPEWLDLDQSVNSSLGAQVLRYPKGFKPTEFILNEAKVPQ